MGRIPRIDIASQIYHVINRSNARMPIFETSQDFGAFENILQEAKSKYAINLYAYQLMPNHWHFCLSPQKDGEMTRFVKWITLTHTKRSHAFRDSAGSGHVYQGRYKSFLIQEGAAFLQVCRYIERNALRAGLVQKAEDWQWSSLWRRMFGENDQKRLLSQWPVAYSEDYLDWVNAPQQSEIVNQLRTSVNRCSPYGKSEWASKMIGQFNLASTLRKPGRPKSGKRCQESFCGQNDS